MNYLADRSEKQLADRIAELEAIKDHVPGENDWNKEARHAAVVILPKSYRAEVKRQESED